MRSCQTKRDKGKIEMSINCVHFTDDKSCVKYYVILNP